MDELGTVECTHLNASRAWVRINLQARKPKENRDQDRKSAGKKQES